MKTILKGLLVLFLGTLELNAIESSTKKLEDTFCKQLKNNKKFCMEYKVEYPLVYSQDTQLARNINNAISKHIPVLNAQKYISNYLQETEGEVFSSGHSDETTITLLAVTKSTFSLDISGSSYTGGAHGNYGSLAYNYDRYTGELLQLKNIFKPYYEETLRAIAEQVYREKNNLTPYDNLQDKQGWLENKFVLPASIGLGADGLHLNYSPYEIKPYVAGTTSFVVPYYLLAPIAKANSVLSTLIPRIDVTIPHKTKNTISKTFNHNKHASIRLKAKVLSPHRVQIDVSMTNHTRYHTGGLSLSFPQLTRRGTLVDKKTRGFNKVTLYPPKSRLYYAPTKRTIRSQYMLVESDTNNWSKDQTKSVSLTLDIPSYIESFYINVRGSLSQNRNIVAVPHKGIEGQQGFGNYRIEIPMR